MPTKEFFISVLTRDIELSRAILDLVDNCVDGARRLRGDPDSASKQHPKPSPSLYKGLYIELTVDADSFVVKDNCGGIPLEIAKNCMRFDSDVTATKSRFLILSDTFGIGMKTCPVQTRRQLSNRVRHNEHKICNRPTRVEMENERRLVFPFDSVRRASRVPEAETGTIITVTELHANVADDFERGNFVSNLHESVGAALQLPISLGLSASVNGIAVPGESPMLLRSKKIKPVARKFSYKPDELSEVRVRLYAGVGEGNLHRAGWNIFCNGRLVLASDQSETTGWGAKKPVSIPIYHNEFHRFHGFVYFDAQNAGALPWNTAKTGIDTDSPIFRTVRTEMILTMRPVIDMLYALKSEDNPSSTVTSRVTSNAYRQAKPAPLRELASQAKFTWPIAKGKPSDEEALVWIRYQRPRTRIELAKRLLAVKSPELVGEKTFDFWELRQK